MIEIKNLLLKFNNILISEEIKKETLKKIISEIIKTPIDKKNIEIKNSTVYLKIKPIYKNEIFLKKDKIFFELKKFLGKKSPQNIK